MLLVGRGIRVCSAPLGQKQISHFAPSCPGQSFAQDDELWALYHPLIEMETPFGEMVCKSCEDSPPSTNRRVRCS